MLCFDSRLDTNATCYFQTRSRNSHIAKQLRFNHRISFKAQEKSAVKIMVVVIGLFLLCYGLYIRCTVSHILKMGKCNDEAYKITFLFLNSAINPVAYAVYKKDIKKEIKRSICCVMVKK